MAENKKSFLLYCDLKPTIDKLTDEEAGKLFKHVLAYVNDCQPMLEDRFLEICFEPIRQSLKRDLKKYEEIREVKRKAGIASAESRKNKEQLSTCVENNEHMSTNSTVSVNDNESDSVNGIKVKPIAENFQKNKNEKNGTEKDTPIGNAPSGQQILLNRILG